MKEIAIFGGAFNPPTHAHEAIIDAALHDQAIKEIWVMPSGTRTDKMDMLCDELRISMLKLMKEKRFTDNNKIVISDFELRLRRPTQTYKTIDMLSRCCPELRFRYIFGADSYQTMHTWEQGKELKKKLNMFLVPRAGLAIPRTNKNIKILNVPATIDMSLSSTMARHAAARGQSIKHIVSHPIENLILESKLYQSSKQVKV